MPCWRRLDTSNWDHKLIRKLFTEVIHQVGSRIIFFYKLTENQNSFLKPSGVFAPPTSCEKECRFKAPSRWPRLSDPEAPSTIYSVYNADEHLGQLLCCERTNTSGPLRAPTITSVILTNTCIGNMLKRSLNADVFAGRFLFPVLQNKTGKQTRRDGDFAAVFSALRNAKVFVTSLNEKVPEPEKFLGRFWAVIFFKGRLAACRFKKKN